MSSYITITSKLTSNQAQTLRRQAEKSDLFIHVGSSKYLAVTEDTDGNRGNMDAHAIARRMMTVAGTTFDYKLS
jgi:hypothetical protein